MKKLYMFLGFLLCAVWGPVHSYGQTITTTQLIDSCYGVKMIVTISPASANLSLKVMWGDGKSTTTNLPSTQTTVQAQYIYKSIGSFTIKTYLLLGGNPIDSTINTYSNYCSYITVQQYLDNDNNCVKNTGEPYFAGNMEIEVDSAGTVVDTFNLHHSLHYKVTPGVVYKFKALNSPIGTSTICPSNGIITVTAPSVGNHVSIKYGVRCGPTSQFDLATISAGIFRPVDLSLLIIGAYNRTCGVKSGVVTLNLDSRYVYKSANPAPTNVTGNVITWNVHNLSVNNTPTMYLYVVPATGANINVNDSICNTITITPTSGDANTANNSIYRCDEVRASCDPNDKHVYPSGDIMPGTKLTYTINFENLGNDTAFNISIHDTLSNNLDLSTFNVESSSHGVSSAFIDGPGGQKVLRFDFVNIRLADKTAPDYNKGFVQFSINAKAGLTPLTQINNRAGIYFDVNPVVLTNYTENRIAPASIGKLDVRNDVAVYPNPVTDVLTIKVVEGEYESVKLVNNIGQVIMHSSLTGTVTQIDMKQLPTGLYYLQVSGKAGSVSHKVEKL